MKAKLHHLIKSEGLTASRFAEMLEIQPAGVSHILAGRNKPSFDLLQKILRRFPKINPDWLLLDSEQMYRDGWNESGEAVGGATANGQFGGGENFGAGHNLGAGGVGAFGGSQNSGMPAGSLFGGVGGSATTPTGGANFPNGSGGGANFHGGQMGGQMGGPTGGVTGGANGGNFGGAAGGANGGANGGRTLGVGNLPFGEAHISTGVGNPPHLSNPRAGQPIQKIVIFYADGTFEAYF